MEKRAKQKKNALKTHDEEAQPMVPKEGVKKDTELDKFIE
jgi:hypothetical protein